MRDAFEALMAEIGPRRRHRVVVVDKFFRHVWTKPWCLRIRIYQRALMAPKQCNSSPSRPPASLVLFYLDVSRLDDWPPLLDFRLLMRSQRFRRLLVGRRNHLPE